MQEQTEIRVFIADDHEVTIQQLSEFINSASGMKVVGTATDGKAVERYFTQGKNGVDVALIDIGMPEMDGLTAVGRIKSKCKEALKVIVITGLHGRNYPAEAISKHADGFIAKSRSKDEFISAIERVHKGEVVYLPDLEDPSQPLELPERPPDLSPSEIRILSLILEGLTSVQIADAMQMGMPSVEKIRYNILHKLGVKNAAQLGVIAERYGLCR